jgi:tubulin alpha
MFEESEQLIPRCVFIDTDVMCIDQAKKSDMLSGCAFVFGKESASDSYARGQYTIGREIMDEALLRISQAVEKCGNLQGFLLLHSSTGGTGSGFTSGLVSRIKVSYKKRVIVSGCLFPSPNISNGTLELYNFGAFMHYSKDMIDLKICFNNEGVYNQLESQIHFPNPDYSHVNTAIAQNLSSLLIGSRDKNPDGNCLLDIQTSLVPYPNLNNISPFHFPLVDRENMFSTVPDQNTSALSQIMNASFLDTSTPLSPSPFIKEQNDLISGLLINRGKTYSHKYLNPIISGLTNSSLNRIKQTWHSIGSLALDYKYNGFDPIEVSQTHSLFLNSKSVSNFFKVIQKKILTVYEKRAFVHWLVGEGLESGEMYVITSELDYLIRDYAI